MLCYGYLGVGLGGVGWGNNVHVNLHTRTHVMLRYGYLLMDQINAKNPFFSCPLWGRKSLTDGGKAWKIIFPKAFQNGCIMESTQKSTLNWKSLSWVAVGENLWDHWHLTGFSKNFARPSKQWASEKKEKSAASQKNTNLCQKTK